MVLRPQAHIQYMESYMWNHYVESRVVFEIKYYLEVYISPVSAL
jgi:hypothetical protein